jgi:hypothetical protein
MCLPGLGRCASTGSAGTVALGGTRRAAPAKTTSPPSSVTRWTARLTQRPCFDVRLDEVDWLGDTVKPGGWFGGGGGQIAGIAAGQR